jgi:hypothetical protein
MRLTLGAFKNRRTERHSRQGSSLTVVASFGPFVLLAQEVSFGGIQRCVERQFVFI